MRLSEAVLGFLLARTADGYSHNTLNIYRHRLAQLTDYLGDPPLDSIKPRDVTRFMAWLRRDYVPNRPGGDTRPLSPSTTSVSGVTRPPTTASPSPQVALITARSRRPLTGSAVNNIPAASAGAIRCTTTARLTVAGSIPCRLR